MRRALVLGYGVVAYIAFVAVFVALEAFVAGVAAIRAIDAGPTGPWWIDVGLLALFGVSHSVLARRSVKAQLPHAIARSTYVVVAAATLGLIVWQWRAEPTGVWRVQGTVARGAVWAVHGAGLVLVGWSTFITDHFDLFGLRQVWLYAHGRPYTPVPFVEHWLYSRVGHPMMLGLLVVFWAAPTMSIGHVVFAAGMSAYIAIGVAFEERALIHEHGEPYRAYRQRVRALLPVRRGGS